MQASILGAPGFAYLELHLEPGQTIGLEPGAMVAMDLGLSWQLKWQGGFFGALALRLCGAETMLISMVYNPSDQAKKLFLAASCPGDMTVYHCTEEQELFAQPGAFVACDPEVSRRVRWAGWRSYLAGEGLFRLSFSGKGRVWLGAFGAIVNQSVADGLVFDTGHLLHYPKQIALRLYMRRGFLARWLAREGWLFRLCGRGAVALQSRCLKSHVRWLNRHF